MIYSCCDENRRAAVLNNPSLNAIDYLELLDDPESLWHAGTANAAAHLPEAGTRPTYYG